MKTDLRMVTAVVSVSLVSLVIVAGQQEEKAKADTVPTFVQVQPPAKPDDPAVKVEAAASATTNAAPVSAKELPKPDTNIVAAVTPQTLKPSPGLAEVIRLLQGGVSEEVVLSYITNS